MVENLFTFIEDFLKDLVIGSQAPLIFYLLGVCIAIFSGICNNLGIVLEKKALNKLPDGKKVGRHLLRNPLWLIGFTFNMILTAILSTTAQLFIGPTLIPGLEASGLIVLAFGSLTILKENLKTQEFIGIGLMIVAITALGFSRLSVEVSSYDFGDLYFLIRVSIFTGILFIGGIICNILQKAKAAQKGIIRAVDSGLMFILTNFWIAPLLGVISQVLSGRFNVVELIIFIMACVTLPLANYLGVLRLQQAFVFGQAGNLRVIQQVPIQIAPIFYYLLIFILIPPYNYSLPLGIIGTGLILISGYLLAKRQAAIKEIK